MTTLRILSLLCALAVLLLGFIYLTVGEASLSLVLPLMSLSFWGIAAFRYAELHRGGVRGIIALLPVIAMGVVAAFATLGTLVYLLQ